MITYVDRRNHFTGVSFTNLDLVRCGRTKKGTKQGLRSDWLSYPSWKYQFCNNQRGKKNIYIMSD